MGLTHFPYGIQATPTIGSNLIDMFTGTPKSNTSIASGANYWFVDGDNGSSGNGGNSPSDALDTIGHVLAKSKAGAVIYVKARTISTGGTDPVTYSESNLTIGPSQSGTKIIGVPATPKQGYNPQLKQGGTSTNPVLKIQAPGCFIYGLTINGASCTGGGILLSDDGSTMTTEGTIIQMCEFKNCVGATATDGSKGGAVQISSTGGSWDTLISDCFFYNNIGGVVLLGTSDAVPQDIEIINCRFDSSLAANRDADIWGNAGSGMVAVRISHCSFGIFPNAGTKNTYMDLTGCTGILEWNAFAAASKTYGAAANVKIPTTVGICGNYQDGALIART